MKELSKAQKARAAIAGFKTLADSIILRGGYRISDSTGRKLENALLQINPEIYGSMDDPRIVELKGLEYVIDRLPRGIETCTHIVMTAQEDLYGTSFNEIIPPKRRRLSYRVSDTEICFVVTRGITEIYDLLTHLTFLNIEARKLYAQNLSGSEAAREWKELSRLVENPADPERGELDRALWNLSIILGRTYKETLETYEYLERNRDKGHNNGLFRIIHALGKRMSREGQGDEESLTISITPSLQEILGHHRYATEWALSVIKKLVGLGLHERPIHIVSANLHSFGNILFGRGALEAGGLSVPDDLYAMVHLIRDKNIDVGAYAEQYGYTYHKDVSGSTIDVQIIDAGRIESQCLHPDLAINLDTMKQSGGVLLVIDYAFGVQAYEIMDELLCPNRVNGQTVSLNFRSISIMGKAGILPGKKGDIMLATAHVMEGTPHNYIVANELTAEAFGEHAKVFCGPMVTVLGTSLQNRDVLQRFHESDWHAVGLEMEGAHYQRAINAAIIQRHIPENMKIRYAYYASDNPLISGETLASGPMGAEGVVPTYLISKVIVEKIFSGDETSP
jgi:hypothetical protein